MSDNYELRCQSTNDDSFEDKSNQLLLPEKNNKFNFETKYTFKEFSDSYIFQIIMVLISVLFIYYGGNYIISKASASPSSMKGGRKKF
jgi:hypothetical protein